MSVVEGSDRCCICLENLAGQGDYEFKCKHRMHAQCAFEYRRRKNTAIICPLCRIQVDGHLRPHEAYPFIALLFGTLRISISLYLAKMAAHATFRAYGLYPVGVWMWTLWGVLVLLALASISTKRFPRRQ